VVLKLRRQTRRAQSLPAASNCCVALFGARRHDWSAARLLARDVARRSGCCRRSSFRTKATPKSRASSSVRTRATPESRAASSGERRVPRTFMNIPRKRCTASVTGLDGILVPLHVAICHSNRHARQDGACSIGLLLLCRHPLRWTMRHRQIAAVKSTPGPARRPIQAGRVGNEASAVKQRAPAKPLSPRWLRIEEATD